MKLVLVICIQAIIWCQISETKDLLHQNEHLREMQLREDAFEKAEALSRMLEIYDQKQLRSMSDLWQSIKNSAVNSWNHIKNIAFKTKKKIIAMIDNLKDKMHQIQAKFEERLKDLQNQIKEIIDKAISTSQNIKKCLQEEKDEIDRIAREILRNVTSCITGNILHLSHLKEKSTLDFDEKDFQNRLDDKLDTCSQKGDIDEDCLHGVREDLYTEVEVMENEILRNGSETRSIAEDLLSTVIFCSTEGLIEASANITMEVGKVAKCVAEESEGEMLTKISYP